MKWANLRTGDILKLDEDCPIPADILLLACSEQEGEAFVQTANLDGERTLKRRRAVLQESLAKEYVASTHR